MDIEGRLLQVQRTMLYVKEVGHVWNEPKPKSSRRLVALPEATPLLLRAYPEQVHAEHRERALVDTVEQLCALPNGATSSGTAASAVPVFWR